MDLATSRSALVLDSGGQRGASGGWRRRQNTFIYQRVIKFKAMIH